MSNILNDREKVNIFPDSQHPDAGKITVYILLKIIYILTIY